MKNKLILLLTALCCSTILYANGVKIGDMYYILDSCLYLFDNHFMLQL